MFLKKIRNPTSPPALKESIIKILLISCLCNSCKKHEERLSEKVEIFIIKGRVSFSQVEFHSPKTRFILKF